MLVFGRKKAEGIRSVSVVRVRRSSCSASGMSTARGCLVPPAEEEDHDAGTFTNDHPRVFCAFTLSTMLMSRP